MGNLSGLNLRGICLLLALMLAPWQHAFAGASPGTTQPGDAVPAATILLRGEIDDYSRDAMIRRYHEARAAGAKIIILQIDTYGGSATAGLEISQFIKRQSDVHTVAFIPDKAISAGAMIALACNEIVMSPGATIGDCAPIMFRSNGSLEPMPPAERAKAESPILADFRDSAQRNGYDPLLAESMVAVDRVVHYVQNAATGQRKFVNDTEYTRLAGNDWIPVAGVPNPVDDGRQLLTVHAEMARRLGLCSEIVDSAQSLATGRGWNIVQTLAPGVGEFALQLLNTGWARMALIAIFVLSLKIAFSTPGHGIPEAGAMISLGLIVGVPLLTGYAQWWEIALIFLGLSLLAFEIFVFPGHFVSGALGLVMIVGGLVLTFVPREPLHPGILPHMPGTWLSLQRGLMFVAGGMFSSLLLWLWLQRYLPKLPYFNKLVLNATTGGDASTFASPGSEVAEPWPAVGAAGRALSELKPGGNAAFVDPATGQPRVTPVISDAGYLPAGAEIVVREVADNRILVRPA
jgi:membrane-bound serine protease (ClpP class)